MTPGRQKGTAFDMTFRGESASLTVYSYLVLSSFTTPMMQAFPFFLSPEAARDRVLLAYAVEVELLQDDTSITVPNPPASSLVTIWPLPATRCQLLLKSLGLAGVLCDDLPAEIVENLVHIGASSGGRLVIRLLAPLFGQLKPTGAGHDAVVLHVGFVAHDD